MAANTSLLTSVIARREIRPLWLVSDAYIQKASIRWQEQEKCKNLTTPEADMLRGALIPLLLPIRPWAEYTVSMVADPNPRPSLIPPEPGSVRPRLVKALAAEYFDDLHAKMQFSVSYRALYAAYLFAGCVGRWGIAKRLGYRDGTTLSKILSGERALPDNKIEKAADVTLCEPDWIRGAGLAYRDPASPQLNTIREAVAQLSIAEAQKILHLDGYLDASVTLAPGWFHPYLIWDSFNCRHPRLDQNIEGLNDRHPSRFPPPPWLPESESLPALRDRSTRSTLTSSVNAPGSNT